MATGISSVLVKILLVLAIANYNILTVKSLPTSTDDKSASKESDRDGKFLSMFTIVNFPNTACNGTSPAATKVASSVPLNSGTCHTTSECSQMGGVSVGKCAAGFGVCCQVLIAGGGRTKAMVSYFVNPGYPNTLTAAKTLAMEVMPRNPDICQLRLDVVEMTLNDQATGTVTAPTVVGDCTIDSITVLGDATMFPQDNTFGLPPLCGSKNAGQHMYVGDFQVTDMAKPITTLNAKVASTIAKKWRIKVEQIDCTDNSIYMRNLRAPSGCAQYHTGNIGTIKSFNFANDGKLQYYKKQSYMICIRRTGQDCEIQYTRDAMVPAYFYSVGAGTTGTGATGGTTKYATGTTRWGCGGMKGSTDTGCGGDTLANGGCIDTGTNPDRDYLYIPQGLYVKIAAALPVTNPMYYQADYFCGSGLGADLPAAAAGKNDGTDTGMPVISQASGPFTLTFNSYSMGTTATGPVGTTDRLGFQITYKKQTLCTNTPFVAFGTRSAISSSESSSSGSDSVIIAAGRDAFTPKKLYQFYEALLKHYPEVVNSSHRNDVVPDGESDKDVIADDDLASNVNDQS